MVKAIILDFDDTLVTTLESKTRALQHTARTFYQFELASEKIKKHWGKPYRLLMQLLFNEIDDEVDSIIKNYESVRHNFPARAYEDVIETLGDIVAQIPVAIVTASSRNLMIKDLKMLQFPYDKFFYIQTAEDTTIHKPDPGVFEPIVSKLSSQGISREDIVTIGDSLNDFFAAKNAGLDFYGIPDRTTQKEEFLKHHAKVLRKFSDIRKLIV